MSNRYRSAGFATAETVESGSRSLPARAGASASSPAPALSVVIPVRNDPENLELCLVALKASEFLDYEVIVVDDASDDATPEVARRFGARLIRQSRRTGPAAARNRGARAAGHEHLFFLDADVAVRPDTLGRVAERFSSPSPVPAFFGSYDASPGASGLVSQFRNLLHHYVHQSGEEKAFTFWSGCGAIEKSVFLELGGFDAGFASASVEDIELGMRLRRAGYEVALVKDIQVKHLKRWRFWDMVKTDIKKRGIPWTLLILREKAMPNDLNLKHGQRASALLAAGVPAAAMSAVLVPAWMPTLAAVALTCLLGIVVLNWNFYRFLSKARSALFALAALPLHVLYYLCGGLAFAFGLVLHLGRRGLRRQSDSG